MGGGGRIPPSWNILAELLVIQRPVGGDGSVCGSSGSGVLSEFGGVNGSGRIGHRGGGGDNSGAAF